MPLTRDFRETVRARAQRDRAFREALFREAIDLLLAGDLKIAKAQLRNYINATVGFDHLAKTTGTPPKSLMRMVSPHGNPRANNLLSVVVALQQATGVQIQSRSSRLR
jgi:DNA-binding phage protein